MEKITIEIIKKHLETNEIALSSTHHELSVPIINRIYQKMIHDIKFNNIQVFENLIIDGHHRYVSSLLANKSIGSVPTLKTSATKRYEWKDVEFVDIEWDTPEKIEKLNRDDAEFNNIPVREIVEMTK